MRREARKQDQSASPADKTGDDQKPGQKSDKGRNQNGQPKSDKSQQSPNAGQGSDGQSPQGPKGEQGSGPKGGDQSQQSDAGQSPSQSGDQSPDESESPAQSPSQGDGQAPKQGKDRNPAKEPGSSKAIVSTAALARFLSSGDPTAQFRTAEGIKTAAEIAQELAQNSGQRFDLQSLDGGFQAKVRGGKAIVEAKPEATKELAKMNQPPSEKLGAATSGSALAGKGDNLPEFNGIVSADIPHELVKMMPLLRGLSGEKRIELMEKWTQIPVRQRVRGGPEYRLLKGMAHLSALKALSQFDEVEEGEQTMSKAGERVDLLRGVHFDAPLDELRTMEEAMAQGGAIDDDAEIREKRVSVDAPNMMFLYDTSGSMGQEGRMQSAMAAGQAVATYYGPKGATFGLTVFADHPASVVPMPEHNMDIVIDGILMLEPGNGTSYARGLELAIRHALSNTTIMVFGDFLDSGFPAPEVYAIAHDKDVKVVGIVSSAGNPEYAAELCEETYTVGSWDDPSAVALVALKAA